MDSRLGLKVKRIVAMLLCVCVLMGFSACEKDEEYIEEGENYVYYIDKNMTKIVPKEYEIKATEEVGMIEELLEQLKRNTVDVEVTKAIPEGVSLEDFTYGDGVVTLSFNAEYNSMNKAQEVLSRAAIVLTLSQLDCVSYVSFFAGGQPVADSNGEAIGNMQASDFADNLNSHKEVYNTDAFAIYFANQSGEQLVKYEFEAEYGSDTSKEQVILNKLIEGPAEEEGYCRTISSNVEVVNVVTMNNVCYVTFGENFLTEPASVSDELLIYSIVNSLSEVPYIHKVQISVNGKTDAVYHGKISLTEAFTRNLDYVEKTEE